MASDDRDQGQDRKGTEEQLDDRDAGACRETKATTTAEVETAEVIRLF